MPRWSDWSAALDAVGFSPPDGELPFAERPGWMLGVQRFSGTLDGKRIELVWSQNAVVREPIDPALDLGLDVRPEGVLVGPKVSSTNAEFDALYVVTADEPARAAELLTAPVLRALVHVLGRSSDVRLGDDAVQVSGDAPGWLRMAVPQIVEIAHHIDGRRRNLRIAAPLQGLRPAVGRFAADHALRIDDNPLRLSGTVPGARVQAVFGREGPHRITMTAHVLAEDSLGLDLRLEPARLLTPLVALFPGQTDHRVGDDAFDAAFHVRTSRPEVLARILDDPLRAALMLCAGRSQSFTLDDGGMVVTVPVVDFGPLPLEVLRAALQAVARLSLAVRAAPPPRPQGPFR